MQKQVYEIGSILADQNTNSCHFHCCVESVQSLGVYVKKPVANTVVWTQGVSPRDIINARVVLEPHIARMAALNISEAEKVELLDIIDRFCEATETGDYSTSADKDFHINLHFQNLW